MYCPICGNPNAGRRHGLYFEDQFYYGDCKRVFEEREWYSLTESMIKEAVAYYFKNKKQIKPIK